MVIPAWILACAGQRVDEEMFAAMTLKQQSWWLETVHHLWEPYVDSDD